jgi:hypothetical protein
MSIRPCRVTRTRRTSSTSSIEFTVEFTFRTFGVDTICSPQLTPDSAVQSNTPIKRQALWSEDNGPLACSGLQSPVAAADSQKNITPGPSTIKDMEMVCFCAFAPPGSPLDRYTDDLYCGIRVDNISFSNDVTRGSRNKIVSRAFGPRETILMCSMKSRRADNLNRLKQRPPPVSGSVDRRRYQ